MSSPGISAPAHVEHDGFQATPLQTAPVKPSKLVKIIVFVFLFIIALIAVTIMWFIHEAKLKAEKEALAKYANTYSVSASKKRQTTLPGGKYNLVNTNYGDTLILTILPKHSAEVELTNDWCPTWSSGQIDTYDQNGIKRIQEGNRYTQGPKASENNFYRLYENTGTNSITVMTGRCKSMNDCTIWF